VLQTLPLLQTHVFAPTVAESYRLKHPTTTAVRNFGRVFVLMARVRSRFRILTAVLQLQIAMAIAECARARNVLPTREILLLVSKIAAQCQLYWRRHQLYHRLALAASSRRQILWRVWTATQRHRVYWAWPQEAFAQRGSVPTALALPTRVCRKTSFCSTDCLCLLTPAHKIVNARTANARFLKLLAPQAAMEYRGIGHLQAFAALALTASENAGF